MKLCELKQSSAFIVLEGHYTSF